MSSNVTKSTVGGALLSAMTGTPTLLGAGLGYLAGKDKQKKKQTVVNNYYQQPQQQSVNTGTGFLNQ